MATDYVKDAILNHVLNNITFPSPVVYVGLSSTTPTDAGTNFTEPVVGGYIRVVPGGVWTTAGKAPGWAAVNARTPFPIATADYGAALTHYGLFDAVSAGNLLYWEPLASSITILSGDFPFITPTKMQTTFM